MSVNKRWEMKELDIVTDKGTWCKGDMIYSGRPVEINKFDNVFIVREIINIMRVKDLLDWELVNWETNYTKERPEIKLTAEQNRLGNCAGYFWLQLKLRFKKEI